MKTILIITVLFTLNSYAQELKIKAKNFDADQKTGISTFKGDVNIIRGNDELNASKVTVYTDKDQQPTKFIAIGDASFRIKTLEGDTYSGTSQKVIYNPTKKEYRFFIDVHLKQLNEQKEIIGEEVVLKTIEGKAYAKGAEEVPVIMIFNIPEKKAK